MKALGLLVGLLLAAPAFAQFQCNEILAFSQSKQWESAPEFQIQIDDARWQTLFRAGGNLDVWADPNADVWRAPITCTGSPGLCSPCASGSTTPDRVILTATLNYFATTSTDVAARLRAAIATIRQKRPSAQQIVLQPVVGGPSNSVCYLTPGAQTSRVRASWNHPFLDQAILEVIHDSPDLAMGPSPEVFRCEDYSDTTGHLDALPSAARGYVGGFVGAWFSTGTPFPTTSTISPPTTVTTIMDSCKLLGQDCSASRCCRPNQGACQLFPWGWRCR
jgi:hypothetical protein